MKDFENFISTLSNFTGQHKNSVQFKIKQRKKRTFLKAPMRKNINKIYTQVNVLHTTTCSYFFTITGHPRPAPRAPPPTLHSGSHAYKLSHYRSILADNTLTFLLKTQLYHLAIRTLCRENVTAERKRENLSMQIELHTPELRLKFACSVLGMVMIILSKCHKEIS